MNLNDINLEDLQRVLHRKAYLILVDSVLGDPTEEARDLVQDTLIQLMEFEGEADPFKLGVTMIQRDTLDLVRTEARRREIEEEHGEKINSTLTGQSAETLAADPYEIMAYEEMRDRLDQLSPMLYSTTYRHYIEGRSVESIATEDECSENAVYKRLQRARNFVSEGLDGEEN